MSPIDISGSTARFNLGDHSFELSVQGREVVINNADSGALFILTANADGDLEFVVVDPEEVLEDDRS